MRLSYSWLSEYVDIPWDPKELIDKLTMSGTEIEGVEEIGPRLHSIVVGEILSIEPHPNADKLAVCRTDVGNEQLTIVCGAKNMAVGDKVPVALVGAKLPNGVVIKQANLRGVDSFGMMCSEIELGLGDDAVGLMILDPSAAVGQNLDEIMGGQDTLIECEITPNRADCMSMIGLAREVAALSSAKLHYPDVHAFGDGRPADDACQVDINNPQHCPRYVAKVIEDIKIGPSPTWLKDKVIKAGFRPINNIVDVTNLIAAELGQPLHAFDYDKVQDHHIIVRLAKDRETIKTLDDVERALDQDMLVIADPSGPIAIAGVMGGAHTEVVEETTAVLLESAHFEPASISRTSRRLGLVSEASIRFERGVDPNICLAACDRAMRLIQEVAGGTVRSGAVDVYPKPIEPRRLELRIERVNDYLGTRLSGSDMAAILNSLELETTPSGDTAISVTIPTFRFDLEREVDLIEEIARIYGYNEIESTLPRSGKKVGFRTHLQGQVKQLKEMLAAAGLDEALTYSFIDPESLTRLGPDIHRDGLALISLENPISADMSVMRPTLVAGLLQALALNNSRDLTDIGLFEIGRVFLPQPDRLLPEEPLKAAIVISGKYPEASWIDGGRDVDFYAVKGLVESILEMLRPDADYQFHSSGLGWLHPSRQAEVVFGGESIGFIGELHPELCSRLDLRGRIGITEFDLNSVLTSPHSAVAFKDVIKHPGIAMDMAVVIDKEIPASKVIDLIEVSTRNILRDIRVFDVYEGEQISSGKKSVAVSLFLQAEDRTLTESEVQQERTKLVKVLNQQLGAEIR